MKKAGVCGHFGIGRNLLNGQTVKTKTVTEELKNRLGETQVAVADSCGGFKAMPRMAADVLRLFKGCENVIMMPANRGLRFFAPLFLTYNKFYRRRIHYIVIGGWLDTFLESHKWLVGLLKKFDAIYVESETMKTALCERGFDNAVVMHNFKKLKSLSENELEYPDGEPYKLCTFSRVMKEKGIEDAIDAVKTVNSRLGRTVYTLDIFGQVDKDYEERFSELKKTFPDFIRCGGAIDADRSTETLKSYFALLFPTYYRGEGFAGTLIDAMSAGVPVIASDWKYNSEFVVPGRTGVIIKNCNLEKLAKVLADIADDSEKWNSMRLSALREAEKYSPEKASRPLIDRINGRDCL
jgi:glycosyltransferase involved in cell wall biosynthesis